MADRIRFHLDEHIHHAIARALQQRGINVSTTVGAGLRTLSDDAQMAYVRDEKRVLVTNVLIFWLVMPRANNILASYIILQHRVLLET